MAPLSLLLLLSALAAQAPAPEARSFALEVPEFSAALVRLPEGDEKLPVLVVTHGAGGSAEQHCQWWSRVVRERAILLCLRGRARGPSPADGEYYPDHLSLERETFAALSALRAGYAESVAEGSVYYAGFSQGATMGALMLVPHAAEVPRLALVEGGAKDWSVARARAFRERGGERVLFVCGQKDCAEQARKSAYFLKLAGVLARVEYVAGAGHSHDSRVEARIASALPWLTASDARWAE
jgi:predicted esterase